ncbi:MAG: hypothetical protein KJS97_08155 [Alphaproteobacteria bacterium]|nr:hypothetical protein [Alphaproteobacteria bacterium]
MARALAACFVLAPTLAFAAPVEPPAAAPAPAPAAAAAPTDAAAVSTTDKVVYDNAFFARFSPQTASDMIERLPGFTLNEGDQRRGFAGTAGNVLIDGVRPSAKSQSLDDLLAQIPARRVARIEVLRNAGGDAQGQALVANVVRTQDGGSGVWKVRGTHTADGRIAPFGEGSYSDTVGGVDYKIGASRYFEQAPAALWRTLTNADGVVTGRRSDETPRTFREARANGEVKMKALGGTLRLNASGGRWNFRTELTSQGYTPDGARTDLFSLKINERKRSRELGGDWTRTFGATTLKLVGLDTREWYANDEATRTTGPGVPTAQKRRNLSSETIARATLSRTIGAHALEAGAETALNRLDADLDLAIDGVPVALAAGDVIVEEERMEAFLADVWTLSPKWTLEARLAAEASTLTQSGDTRAKAEFSFVKPSVQIARKFGARNQARVRLYRDVGQLDFGDFASSAALADDRVAAGNPGLRPDSRWRLEAAVDQRFGAKGALSVTVIHDWISDVQDVAPIDGFDAPGNIGSGELSAIAVKATAPMDRWLKGLTATLDGEWRTGEVTDPTTGRAREPTTLPPYTYTVELRRDDAARKLAYGVRYRKQAEFQFYRTAEIETFEEGANLTAYLDSTRIKGAKVSLIADNLLNRSFHRERRFFTPDRRGAPAFAEVRDRQQGRVYAIEVSGTF